MRATESARSKIARNFYRRFNEAGYSSHHHKRTGHHHKRTGHHSSRLRSTRRLSPRLPQDRRQSPDQIRHHHGDANAALELSLRLEFSFRQLLADRLQFLPALCARFGVSHLEYFERIEDNLRYNQSRVLFVVGGNDIPRRVPGACRTEAFLIRLHVLFPEFPLLNIRKAKFPILFRLIDALKETLSLLLLRKVEEELDDAGSVAVEVSLQIHDGMIPVVPDRLVGVRCVRDPFAAENFGMHADDQHLLVVGSVEDANPPAFR